MKINHRDVPEVEPFGFLRPAPDPDLMDFPLLSEEKAERIRRQYRREQTVRKTCFQKVEYCSACKWFAKTRFPRFEVCPKCGEKTEIWSGRLLFAEKRIGFFAALLTSRPLTERTFIGFEPKKCLGRAK